MKLLTITAVRDFFQQNPELEAKLKKLFCISHVNKQALFKEEDINEYQDLIDCGFLNKPGGSYEFDFSLLPVCYVLKQAAQERLCSAVPEKISEALAFADQFYLSLREPKPNFSWYLNLAMEFDRFLLVWLNQEIGIDISEFYKSITPEMLDQSSALRSFGNNYSGAFPFLTDSNETTLNMIRWMHSDENAKHFAGDAVTDLAKENPKRAASFYQFAKAGDAIADGDTLSRLLIELYTADPDKYFAEAEWLFGSAPEKGSVAISWLPYTDPSHIKKAFDLMDTITVDPVQLPSQAPAFYTRIVENKNTPDEVRTACFIKIGELLKIADDNFRANLIHRLGWMDAYEEEKFLLLPQIVNINPRYITDIFKKFKRADLLFAFFKSIYLELGPKINLNLFTDAFADMQRNNAAGFEEQLLFLLTDDLPMLRMAGVQVLGSKYSGMYVVDFLKLNEAGQLRAIETLLPHPHSIEQLLPQILFLRNSEHSHVKASLLGQLKELIWAYDHHLVDMITPLIDLESKADQNFLKEVNGAFEEYLKVKGLKQKISEFNPVLNEPEDYEYYYQIEQEQRAKMMEKAGQMSFIGQLAKEISIIRGNAFKVESSKDITRTAEVSTSMLLDMRYYRNPDAYEFNFQQQFKKDYDTEEATDEP